MNHCGSHKFQSCTLSTLQSTHCFFPSGHCTIFSINLIFSPSNFALEHPLYFLLSSIHVRSLFHHSVQSHLTMASFYVVNTFLESTIFRLMKLKESITQFIFAKFLILIFFYKNEKLKV